MTRSCDADPSKDGISTYWRSHVATALRCSISLASHLVRYVLKGTAFVFVLGLLPSALSIAWNAGANTLMVFCTPKQAQFLMGGSTQNPYRLQTELLSREFYQQLYRIVGILVANPLLLRQFSRMIAMPLSVLRLILDAIRKLFHPLEIIKLVVSSVLTTSPATLRHYILPPMLTAIRFTASSQSSSTLILLFIPLVVFPFTVESREVAASLFVQFVLAKLYDNSRARYQALLQGLTRRKSPSCPRRNKPRRSATSSTRSEPLDSESGKTNISSSSRYNLLSIPLGIAVAVIGQSAIMAVSKRLNFVPQLWGSAKLSRSFTAFWICEIAYETIQIFAINIFSDICVKKS